MWLFSRKGVSGFSKSSTAEEVTRGIDGSGLTAVVTGVKSLCMLAFQFLKLVFDAVNYLIMNLNYLISTFGGREEDLFYSGLRQFGFVKSDDAPCNVI